MARDFEEEAYSERQIFACATVVHNIPKEDMQVLCLPLLSPASGDRDPEVRWIALLVHANGMRKILAKTPPQLQEFQAVNILLGMVRQSVKEKLFG